MTVRGALAAPPTPSPTVTLATPAATDPAAFALALALESAAAGSARPGDGAADTEGRSEEQATAESAGNPITGTVAPIIAPAAVEWPGFAAAASAALDPAADALPASTTPGGQDAADAGAPAGIEAPTGSARPTADVLDTAPTAGVHPPEAVPLTPRTLQTRFGLPATSATSTAGRIASSAGPTSAGPSPATPSSAAPSPETAADASLGAPLAPLGTAAADVVASGSGSVEAATATTTPREPAQQPTMGQPLAPTSRGADEAPTRAATAATAGIDALPSPVGATSAAQSSAPAAATAPAAAPSTAAPAQPLNLQLSRHLVDIAAAGNGNHTVTVTVTPENLGPVTVHALVSGDDVRLELFSASEAGREALKQVLADLRRDLAASGLQANLDLSSKNQPDARQNPEPQPAAAFARRSADADAAGSRESPLEASAHRLAFGDASTLDVLA